MKLAKFICFFFFLLFSLVGSFLPTPFRVEVKEVHATPDNTRVENTTGSNWIQLPICSWLVFPSTSTSWLSSENLWRWGEVKEYGADTVNKPWGFYVKNSSNTIYGVNNMTLSSSSSAIYYLNASYTVPNSGWEISFSFFYPEVHALTLIVNVTKTGGSPYLLVYFGFGSHQGGSNRFYANVTNSDTLYHRMYYGGSDYFKIRMKSNTTADWYTAMFSPNFPTQVASGDLNNNAEADNSTSGTNRVWMGFEWNVTSTKIMKLGIGVWHYRLQTDEITKSNNALTATITNAIDAWNYYLDLVPSAPSDLSSSDQGKFYWQLGNVMHLLRQGYATSSGLFQAPYSSWSTNYRQDWDNFPSALILPTILLSNASKRSYSNSETVSAGSQELITKMMTFLFNQSQSWVNTYATAYNTTLYTIYSGSDYDANNHVFNESSPYDRCYIWSVQSDCSLTVPSPTSPLDQNAKMLIAARFCSYLMELYGSTTWRDWWASKAQEHKDGIDNTLWRSDEDIYWINGNTGWVNSSNTNYKIYIAMGALYMAATGTLTQSQKDAIKTWITNNNADVWRNHETAYANNLLAFWGLTNLGWYSKAEDVIDTKKEFRTNYDPGSDYKISATFWLHFIRAYGIEFFLPDIEHYSLINIVKPKSSSGLQFNWVNSTVTIYYSGTGPYLNATYINDIDVRCFSPMNFSYSKDYFILPTGNLDTANLNVTLVYSSTIASAPYIYDLKNATNQFKFYNVTYTGTKLTIDASEKTDRTVSFQINAIDKGDPTSVKVNGTSISKTYDSSTKLVSFNVTFSSGKQIEVSWEAEAGYNLNLKTTDWAGNVLTEVTVTYYNQSDMTEKGNGLVDSGGWKNFTSVQNGTYKVKGEWYGTIVAWVSDISVSGNDVTQTIQCKVWDLQTNILDNSGSPLTANLYMTLANGTQNTPTSINSVTYKVGNGTFYYAIQWQGSWVYGNTSVSLDPSTPTYNINAKVYSNYALSPKYNDGSTSFTPTQITVQAPNGTLCPLSSTTISKLQNGTWTIKEISYWGTNVKPSTDPTFSPTGDAQSVSITCRVYGIGFSNVFKDMDGIVTVSVDSFKVTFPNGTTSGSLSVGAYWITNGTTTWVEVLWKGMKVSPSGTFDATNGNPSINLFMKPQTCVSGGCIGFNQTVTSLTINSQTASNLTFTGSGSGAYMMKILVPQNATYLKKDAVNQTYGTVWTYDSTNKVITIQTSSLSVWELIFPEVAQGGTTLPTLVLQSIRNNYYIVIGLVGLMPIMLVVFMLLLMWKGKEEIDIEFLIILILLCATLIIAAMLMINILNAFIGL